MEHSNSDLRQKIDTLQNELSTLESQLKDKMSSWEARLLQEKAVVEEHLRKENFETEKRLKNEIQEIKERLTNERRATEERLIKEKETVEQNFIEQKEILEDRLKNFENDYRSEIAEKEKSYSNLCSKFDSVQTEMDSLKNVCEQKTQEWQDLEQDMNLLLQAGGVPNQENSRILKVSATGVQLKIKTLYQIKNEAIKELSSLKENYRTLDKSLENKQKVAEYSSKIQSLEDRISTIENDNTALSNQIQSVKDSELHLKTLVASLESQVVEEKEKVSKYEVGFSEIYQVVTAIPHLPPKYSDDIKSTLLFLSSERENLKKQLLEEITNNEELSKELKDFKENLTEIETENKYLLSKLGDTEKQLRLLQEEIQAKLSTAKTSETQTVHNLITEEGVEESINQCKAELHKEYEANLSEIKTIYENKKVEIEKAWKEKMAEMLKRREREMQQSLDQLTEQWNKEKAEVERLTQVASAAFKNGTDSMELLKKQVITLRKELDDMKRNHKKEIGELQALLEIKKRRSRGDHGEVKLGASIEDAAEFEYLKYILYQYMMGKETQTLSKVLCEVVKFSKEQQREVVEFEENKQSLLRNEEILSSQADNSEQKQSES